MPQMTPSSWPVSMMLTLLMAFLMWMTVAGLMDTEREEDEMSELYFYIIIL